MDKPTGKNDEVVQLTEAEEAPKFHEPTPNERELKDFVLEHTDDWREYRDQNFLDDWEKYERIWRGQWKEEDKHRQSERSRIISPATQQAIETAHAEKMEAIFGQGEFFAIADDLKDKQHIDVEVLERQLYEDFAQDKIRKSIDQIGLMACVYGTGIGEVVVGEEKQYKPAEQPIGMGQIAYGTRETTRVSVKLNPVNPKNFLWDPNGTEVNDCMGVAVERYVSMHKIRAGIKSGKYLNVDIASTSTDEKLEPTQEKSNFDENKVLLLTYYGLVPREYLAEQVDPEDSLLDAEDIADEGSDDDLDDMVEAIVVIANGGILLKAVESPYMMKDRPVLTYQDDTVPNRLPGRGIAEKAFNMQAAIDGSMRAHMDALALTVAPMMGMDATRLPRGAKFEVKPGKSFLTNGNPSEILFPFKFGTNDGAAMQTSKEFERMLLMATATVDSNGTTQAVARDGQSMDMATATMIKKYKRTLVNFQEDFLIPFIYKAAWRYMQFDPERYPSVDVKFIPTATLGIIAREFEQRQLAFLMQTLGAQSPLTPILMQGILKNSSLSNKEEMLQGMAQQSQPDPQQQQMAQQAAMLEMQSKQADTQLKQAQAGKAQAEAQKATVEAQIAPEEAKAKMIAALSNNLDDENEGKDFERRAKIAELMLKEKDITSNENIAKMQMEMKRAETTRDKDYLKEAAA
jgi:hypothetical protein